MIPEPQVREALAFVDNVCRSQNWNRDQHQKGVDFIRCLIALADEHYAPADKKPIADVKTADAVNT